MSPISSVSDIWLGGRGYIFYCTALEIKTTTRTTTQIYSTSTAATLVVTWSTCPGNAYNL